MTDELRGYGVKSVDDLTLLLCRVLFKSPYLISSILIFSFT